MCRYCGRRAATVAANMYPGTAGILAHALVGPLLLWGGYLLFPPEPGWMGSGVDQHLARWIALHCAVSGWGFQLLAGVAAC
ncbi:hypothetical protein F5Y08DRAFT_160836 [Xylaria arbuscula]|nr:hypothetical protein F5Y08DRAFT_160836 [Xylaria arbuscula]